MVKEYFIAYEQQFPEQRSELRRISLALRRNGIETMPELYQMYRDNRKQLLQLYLQPSVLHRVWIFWNL